MAHMELGLVTDTAADLSPRILDEAVGAVPIYVHRTEWNEGLKKSLEGALRLEKGRITRSGATIAANVGLGAIAIHAYSLE